MTTERIDHDAEARGLLAAAKENPADASLHIDPWLQAAQVHATLALVEQQRIANLLAIAHWVSPEHLGTKLDALRMGVAGEVWEGLGL